VPPAVKAPPAEDDFYADVKVCTCNMYTCAWDLLACDTHIRHSCSQVLHTAHVCSMNCKRHQICQQATQGGDVYPRSFSPRADVAQAEAVHTSSCNMYTCSCDLLACDTHIRHRTRRRIIRHRIRYPPISSQKKIFQDFLRRPPQTSRMQFACVVNTAISTIKATSLTKGPEAIAASTRPSARQDLLLSPPANAPKIGGQLQTQRCVSSLSHVRCSATTLSSPQKPMVPRFSKTIMSLF